MGKTSHIGRRVSQVVAIYCGQVCRQCAMGQYYIRGNVKICGALKMIKALKQKSFKAFIWKPTSGLEPLTCSLRVSCSTS